MIGKDKLTEKEKDVLRALVNYTCETCKRHEDECGKLQPHRMVRAHAGGKYCPRNIQMDCDECHKAFHANEQGGH